jgi:hypothetical protein
MGTLSVPTFVLGANTMWPARRDFDGRPSGTQIGPDIAQNLLADSLRAASTRDFHIGDGTSGGSLVCIASVNPHYLRACSELDAALSRRHSNDTEWDQSPCEWLTPRGLQRRRPILALRCKACCPTGCRRRNCGSTRRPRRPCAGNFSVSGILDPIPGEGLLRIGRLPIR